MEPRLFCPFCGQRTDQACIEGRQRPYCAGCKRPIYINPVPATCVVLPDDNNLILLVKRAVDPRKGLWCLPGGFMELGESPQEAAMRELKEETGLSGRIEALLGVCATPSEQYDTILMVGYAARQNGGRLQAGDDANDIGWFDISALPRIAFDSHRRFINHYSTAPRPFSHPLKNL